MNAEVIKKCFFLDDTAVEADVAIVLGMNDWRRPAERAVQLYQSGKVGQLLFTGGYNKNIDAHEAVEMSTFARRAGLPEPAILVEPHAVHTNENLAYSKAVLDTYRGLDSVQSVVLITIHYHLRRAILAARNYLPSSIQIGWTSYPSLHYSASNWHQSARGRADIASEVAKIERYYEMSLSDLAGSNP